jgi:hypothetical protein
MMCICLHWAQHTCVVISDVSYQVYDLVIIVLVFREEVANAISFSPALFCPVFLFLLD